MRIIAKQISNDNAKIVIETNRLALVTTIDPSEDINHLPQKGYFDYLNGELIMLVSFENKIYLYFNNEFHFFNNENIKVDYQVLDKEALLTFYNSRDDKTTIIRYSTEEKEPISTLWYTEDEEDSNLGLWIYNVLNNQERIEIMRQHYSE
ncbi:hypothetical protein [Flavobacterium sp. CAU 1735]|uniref:hypothetical protein n=1 Tax=Flavobacterium sp. CAU 1735 TaxID=3140361 RepID=UPI0032618A57